jgi:hypothetical protein
MRPATDLEPCDCSSEEDSVVTKDDTTSEPGTPAETPKEATPAPQQMDPEVAAKIAELRSALRENFGKVVLAMMMVPRYRSQSLRDLQHLVLDPC